MIDIVLDLSVFVCLSPSDLQVECLVAYVVKPRDSLLRVHLKLQVALVDGKFPQRSFLQIIIWQVKLLHGDANSVRTVAFCALETILGYGFGDSKSNDIADKSIAAIQLTQVKNDGIISQYNSGSYITERCLIPNAIGSFYTFWKQDGLDMPFSHTSPSNPIKQVIEELYGHFEEHGDIEHSNIEIAIICSHVLNI